MTRVCFLNGEFVALGDARVSVLDRGFIFGDAIYEVMVTCEGRLFALPQHLARLRRSLDAIALADPLSDQGWAEMLRELVRRNGTGEHSVYVQVTRGVAERDHAMPSDIAPTVFAMTRAFAPAAQPARLTAVVHADNRWLRCDIKSTSLLPNVLLRSAAVAAGAHEAILVRDGAVTEGAASNVFVVKHGGVATPPLSESILPGVTRDLLLDFLLGLDIAVSETPVSMSQLRAADEIWLTSTTRDIAIVETLDGRPVGNGADYPLAARAFRDFQLFKGLHLS
jgi:D-alanine transaminase